MKRRYRIVTDRFNGYEVQYKPWWWPFWIQCSNGTNPTNTHHSLDDARAFAAKHKAGLLNKKSRFVEEL